MTEQVMIYEVKSAAASNAKVLFSDDKKYFYWNEIKFKNLSIGDYVFVVNKKDNWVLFTKLDKQNIETKPKGSDTIFKENNKEYQVAGSWKAFIRLDVLQKMDTPPDWQWKSLGSSENTYLHGDRISLNSANNRVQNIEQISQLTDDKKVLEVLTECKENFLDVFSAPKQKTKISKPYSKNDMNILTAIKTKPFILLAGISGTGKSRLVRTLAFQTCPLHLQDEELKKPGNYELIPVRPNWHDSSELMGYVSRINGEKYITTAFLKFIAKAWKNIDTPFFLCLDEMNLAPVEQYFAEYLSIIETRQVKKDDIVTDYIISRSSFEDQKLYTKLLEDLGLNERTFSEGISIPKNLIVIGTVNMDETTHSFSRKVLDRAMTFEMNEVDLLAGLDLEQNDWSYPYEIIEINQVVGEFTSGAEVYNDTFKERIKVLDFLQKVNRELEGTPFKIAYRVRDEFLIYCYHTSQNNSNTNWLMDALDEMTSMKILSRIEGDENKTQHVLSNLLKIITSDYKKSHSKLLEMQNRLQSSGYTSFWS